MKKLQLFLACVLLGTVTIYSQGTSGTNAKFEYRSLIDLPTAGILERGYVGVGLDALPFGVVVTKIEVGVFNNFSFGISYGGGNIIGSGKVDWYELPGVNIRFRPVDETPAFPAIAIGFDSQGKGIYDDSKNRYQIKSPGFFIAAAKNFEFFGYLSLHGNINYSLERDDGDKDVNLGIGIEKTIGDQVSFVAEYDFAINDNTGGSIGDGNGYLNMGLRWSVGEGFTVGLDLRNLLDNSKLTSSKADRGIFVEYVTAVF
jgi:hypothetical protein